MDASIASAMPEWDVAQWFNTERPIRLADLRGQVVLVHAFQMLCPGCVINAIPQARQVHRLYGRHGVAVIGLHTVFEHHDAMQPHALQAFIHEYGLHFPVGVDAPADNISGIPRTMQRLGLQGTPTTLVLDRQGRLRVQHFGHVDDLQLGVLLGRLLAESAAPLPQGAA
ncbi:MAG: redoxin domain-containing protein [Burkholderiales bacterium]|nr:redoxin domain-containing protein [Burkholderiales bacterium]MBK8666369.1 redoxin domain-containing protein [Burkholderiales bacterium]